jgi:hypothetical protein
MATNRRELIKTAIALGAGFRLGAGPKAARAQVSGAREISHLSGADARLFRSIEDLPWVASPGPAQRPVYVLYAPWCPNCKHMVEDVDTSMDKLFPDIQLRWTGCSPNNATQALLIANAVKQNDFSVIARGFGRTSQQLTPLPDGYVRRAISSSLLYVLLKSRAQNTSSTTGFPMIIYAAEGKVVTHAGYSPQSLASWSPAVRNDGADFVPATRGKLEDVWTDDAVVPSGRFSATKQDHEIFSLPYRFAVAVSSMPKGYGAPARRFIRVDGHRWVELENMYTINNYPFNAYIKTS